MLCSAAGPATVAARAAVLALAAAAAGNVVAMDAGAAAGPGLPDDARQRASQPAGERGVGERGNARRFHCRVQPGVYRGEPFVVGDVAAR